MLHEDNTLSTDQQIRLYFGIENVGLGHDTLYYDAMIGIQHNLDSIIFFSDMLFRELDLISRKLSVSIGKGAGKPTTFSFQKDIPAGVFPDKDDFPDWT